MIANSSPTLRRLVCLLTLGAVGCAHAPSPPIAARVGCPARAAIDESWQLKDLGAFRVRLPDGFEREDKLHCYEGGKFLVRGTERVGYCMGFDETVGTGEGSQAVTFRGAPARLDCYRYSSGDWSVGITPVRKSGFSMSGIFALVHTRAMAAQVITALLAAE